MNYRAEFTTIGTSYLYFEVPDEENPGEVLDSLLASGELEAPGKPDDTDDFEYSDIMLEGWVAE